MLEENSTRVENFDAIQQKLHHDTGGGDISCGGGGGVGVVGGHNSTITNTQQLQTHITQHNSSNNNNNSNNHQHRNNDSANDEVDMSGSTMGSAINETMLKKHNNSIDDHNEDDNEDDKNLAIICQCTNPGNCVTLKNILDSFKAPLSEEQAWALIYQFMLLYRKIAGAGLRHIFNDFEIPDSMENINLHRDGSVHCSWSVETKRSNGMEQKQQQQHQQQQQQQQRKEQQRKQQHSEVTVEERAFDNSVLLITSHKKILRKVAVIVYTALDYNLQADEQCHMSQELEELITFMTAEESDDDCIDEGIDEGFKRWDDENDDEKYNETKEFDFVLETCKNHIKPTVAEDHYRAVCRALVTETIELRIFLQQVLNDGAENLKFKADTQTSQQELAKLGFNDWARFWVQVIDELRRGVRLKKNTYSRAPTEYELTPYEILMEDIRTKKYQLRKVMVNGDIPPRVKKDAHAVILEFIRSRPPLKKASERQLPPPLKRVPSPREQLMDSIRKGQTLKHIQPPRLKDRLLPPTNNVMQLSTSTTANNRQETLRLQDNNASSHTTPRSKQRLIKVDFSLLQDDDLFFDDDSKLSAANTTTNMMGVCSQPKMPPYPIGGYMIANESNTKAPKSPPTTRIVRRTTYDLATQCESRRASLRRHTIVGCQSNFDETHSMPTSRPASRQSDDNQINEQISDNNASRTKMVHKQLQPQQQQLQLKRTKTPNNDLQDECNSSSSQMSSSAVISGPWNKSFLDEKTWHERGDERLSLTLDEIVHIRSVMTKAELEGLPGGVRIKEDVEKRKVCFLCLRTRFSIFGPWGIQCKICQRTVCSKCYTKMRIPSEHFRNVPLVLISPSLLSSPAGSSTPSPSHHAHYAHSSSTGNILDETFPKSLIERLLRTESERKTRNSVGSAPSSPKHQRSNISIQTTSKLAETAAGQAVEAIHDTSAMTSSYPTAATTGGRSHNINEANTAIANSVHNKMAAAAQAKNAQYNNMMSRSMEGPRSLPVNSPARPHSNSSTLDRKNRFPRGFTLSSSGSRLSQDQKENMRGEQVSVCNDCEGLVMEITRSAKQKRSSARNRTLQNLTLDLSPVWK